MKKWIYPIIAFVFNYILFHTFYWGEYGTGLVVVLTIPLIAIVSILFTIVHYILEKKKVKTKLFQIISTILIIFISYLLFPTNNKPHQVIQKMVKLNNLYSDITINDYFKEPYYYNFERQVLAKKKFESQLSDTAFSVKIENYYDYKKVYKTYGICFWGNTVKATNKNIKIEKLSNNSFLFTDYINNDTIKLKGNVHGIKDCSLKKNKYKEFGKIHQRDTTLKQVVIKRIIKSQTPDQSYWIYKFYYWLIKNQ